MAEHGKGFAEAARAQAQQEAATATSQRQQAESNMNWLEQAKNSAVAAQGEAEVGMQAARKEAAQARAEAARAVAAKTTSLEQVACHHLLLAVFYSLMLNQSCKLTAMWLSHM